MEEEKPHKTLCQLHSVYQILVPFFLLLVVYNVILKFRLLFISAYTRQKKRDMGAVRIVSGLRLGSLVSAQHP